MAPDHEQPWLNVLARNSGFRRALIVHENVNDVFYSSERQDYLPIVDTVAGVLKRRGFDEVVVWDRFAGMQNVSADVRDAMSREAVSEENGGQQATGEDYDMGETSAQPPARPVAPATHQTPEDFLALVHHHILHPGPRRYAFVVDWTHFLFGSANALSEQERQWLLILSKAIRDSRVPMNAGNIAKPANLLVLLCNKMAGIPPVFYQGNPAVHDIAVPMPGRLEREALVKRSLHQWLLRKPLTPGDTAFQDFVDSLDGFTLRDLQQLIRLSRQGDGEPLTPEKLINLYKYGEQTSPWEDLSRTKLAGVEDALKHWVKGQDDAISKVRTVIIRAFTGLSGLQHSRKQRMPKGVLFFVGPTGVGKTELAKAIARFLFGDEDACLRFDMSEYNHEHSDQRLVGAPPGYVGYEEGGQLTNAVKRRPFSVLLFDEIEKAHGRILDKFLQILEDGRLTDGKGDTVYFSETVIVFTSNIGAAEMAQHMGEDPDAVKQQFCNKVREHFVNVLGRPELLNRIGDNIVPFNFITSDRFLADIARAKLAPLKERLREKYRITDVVFDDEEKSLAAIVGEVDRANGGRGVLNEIVKRIHNPLAEFLFQEEDDPSHYAGRTIRIRQAGDTPQFFFVLE